MVENQALNIIGNELAQNLLVRGGEHQEVHNPAGFEGRQEFTDSKFQMNNIQQSQTFFDPDSFPYSIVQAQNHAKAKRVCQKKDETTSEENQLVNENNTPLPLCCSRNDFDDLGPGIPLYFETILYCIIMLVAIFLVQGIYSLISNFLTDDCLPLNSKNEAVCHRDLISRLSVANKFKHQDLFIIQSWVNLASILVVIISLHYYRVYQKHSAEEIDRNNISPADYTVMIKKLPKENCNEKLVEDSVNSFWRKVNRDSDKSIVTKIVLAYNIVDFVTCCRERKQLLVWKRKAEHTKQHEGKYPKDYNEDEFNKKMSIIDERLKKQELEVQSGKTCGIAFVSFRTQKSLLFLLISFK